MRAFAADELADPRPIDLLANNAGVTALPERRVSPDGHELRFSTKVLGPFELMGLLLPRVLEPSAPQVVTVSFFAHTQFGPTPLCLPHLKTKPNSAIINVFSKLAFVSFPISAVNSATKAGVHALTECLRVQLKNTKAQVVDIAPPGTQTPLFRQDFTTEDLGGAKRMDV